MQCELGCAERNNAFVCPFSQSRILIVHYLTHFHQTPERDQDKKHAEFACEDREEIIHARDLELTRGQSRSRRSL